MLTSSRRQFIAGCLSAGSLVKANPLGLPLGFQVFPIREMLAKDFEGTLRQMAALGYRSVEMCSPRGYVSSGFGPLTKIPAKEMRRIIRSPGLRCESCHFGFRELKTDLDARIAFSKELGLKYMVVSSFGVKPDATMDDWRRAASDMNPIAERIRKAGMQAAYHNHNFEFREIGGALVYDELMKVFDPKLVQMQFQVAVISIGFEAATYLTKYPGRFCSLHLADWSASEKKMVAVGKGVVDWKKLFAAAKGAGVKNYFVEMNLDAMKESAPYLKALKV